MGGKNELSFLRDGPDPSFGWEKLPSGLRIVSQEWKGTIWSHDLWVLGEGKSCLLFITGDLVPEVDGAEFELLCEMAQMPVAMLFQVPNQPLWDMREDDLIAYSFEKWLETRDIEWPVVFAMARSVIRAMDALAEAYGFEKFVLAGGSKRGWTAWLAALCEDDRVVGVCPMVFDNLNMPVQMQSQLAHWGAFSPKLDDYTRRQLQAMLETDEGLTLSRLVDPLTYMADLRCPIHLIHGSNDEFWVSDATANYWEHIPEPKSLTVVPNVGHNLGDSRQAYQTLGEFARRCAAGLRFPTSTEGASLSVWKAESPDLHFHDKTWVQGPVETPKSDLNVAYFIEAVHHDPAPFRLTTVPKILRTRTRLGDDRTPDPATDIE